MSGEWEMPGVIREGQKVPYRGDPQEWLGTYLEVEGKKVRLEQ